MPMLALIVQYNDIGVLRKGIRYRGFNDPSELSRKAQIERAQQTAIQEHRQGQSHCPRPNSLPRATTSTDSDDVRSAKRRSE